jgi:hypothetical protein
VCTQQSSTQHYSPASCSWNRSPSRSTCATSTHTGRMSRCAWLDDGYGPHCMSPLCRSSQRCHCDTHDAHREHAVRDLNASPYYRTWDAEARDAFVRHALTTLPSGAVRTKSHPVLVSFPRSPEPDLAHLLTVIVTGGADALRAARCVRDLGAPCRNQPARADPLGLGREEPTSGRA